MVASPDLLVEETARAIERLQVRLEKYRALLATLPQESREVSKAAGNIALMEKGLKRLQLYSAILKSEAPHSAETLIRERDKFGKQYKRKWRPSRSRQTCDDD
jgi:hypothetical protein